MRIVLAVDGTRGDVYPMLSLGSTFQAGGHDVILCAPPDFQTEAEERGLEFHAVGCSVREYLGERAEFLGGGVIRILRESNRYLEASLEAQFRSLPEAVRGADRIVAAGLQAAARSFAELHEVPYRYVAFCPCLLPSQEHAPMLVRTQSLPQWANRLSWRAALPLCNRLLRPRINRYRRDLGLPPTKDAIFHWLGERPVLAADPELARIPDDCPLPVEQIRCLHPIEGPPLPPKLEAFLEQGPPPVYLGFGSMTDPQPTTTTRKILDAVTALGCRALLCRGWAELGTGPLPEGVLRIGSVSHARLFPRLAAVVHHGGAGTTHTAARAGVPQILVPHVFDQFYWAKRVRELGLGPPAIPRTALCTERIAEALRVTLDNEILRERAHEFGGRLRERVVAEPVLSI
jgi:UDP:flavonoid glycosyltransferase YjiC (YdhE family)